MSDAPPSPLRTVRLDLEFDGTAFLGWQRQAVGRTVQGEVEAALARILGAPHAVVGAGRTDAGAHARHMVASFRTAQPIAPARLARALDAVLPEDVGVLSVREASPAFHARRDARWKWYRYTILPSRLRRPLLRRTAWQVGGRLPRDVLRAGAAALEGRHDFRSFANVGSPRRTTVRTLHVVRWTDIEGLLYLDLVGDGFLYKMVRTIVGTLVQIARRPREDGTGGVGEEVRALLDAADRRAAGPAAPARGLCLMAVGIGEEPPVTPIPDFLRPAVESAHNRTEGGHP
ncbi:MAG: tRNA pseudouridine(38-40) synthase TruA [Planctomycetota bacterium]|jgi:tRNA pseudouridine38-40 synthase